MTKRYVKQLDVIVATELGYKTYTKQSGGNFIEVANFKIQISDYVLG